MHEGEEQEFLHLVDTLVRGYRDLFHMKLDKEMSNNIGVSMTEEKLPRDIGREWAKEVNKTGSSVKYDGKFPFLFKFLLEQKRIIEYQAADLRNTIPSKKEEIHGIDGQEDDDEQKKPSNCLIHGNSNHLTGNCSVYLDLPPTEKVNFVKEHRACYSCLKVGHKSWDCRIRKQCT